MSDLDRQLGDLRADGKIGDEDVDAVQTFALFLRESHDEPRGFRSPTFRARWLAWAIGEADGPVEP